MKRLMKQDRGHLRQIRHGRIIPKVKGTAQSPRLSVFRSLKGMVAQLIDDEKGRTLCYASSKEVSKKKGDKVSLSRELGKLLAKKAKEKNIEKVRFDRGGYKYHGRVKALAEGAREGGLIL